MKKTILCLSLSFSLCTDIGGAAEPLALEQTALVLPPVSAPTAPTAETTAPREESVTKTLCKKAWKSCKGSVTKTAHATKEACAHPLKTLKRTPDATVKALKVCHAKALDFSDKHERDFKLIGNLTTLFGAYFFVRNSFNNFGKSTNKTVIVGQ